MCEAENEYMDYRHADDVTKELKPIDARFPFALEGSKWFAQCQKYIDNAQWHVRKAEDAMPTSLPGFKPGSLPPYRENLNSCKEQDAENFCLAGRTWPGKFMENAMI